MQLVLYTFVNARFTDCKQPVKKSKTVGLRVVNRPFTMLKRAVYTANRYIADNERVGLRSKGGTFPAGKRSEAVRQTAVRSTANAAAARRLSTIFLKNRGVCLHISTILPNFV